MSLVQITSTSNISFVFGVSNEVLKKIQETGVKELYVEDSDDEIEIKIDLGRHIPLCGILLPK
jgi:hypothetical protein